MENETKIEENIKTSLAAEILIDINSTPKKLHQGDVTTEDKEKAPKLFNEYNLALMYLNGYKLEDLATIYNVSYTAIRNRITKMNLSRLDQNMSNEHKINKLLPVKECTSVNDELNRNIMDNLIKIGEYQKQKLEAFEEKLIKIELLLIKVGPVLDKCVLYMNAAKAMREDKVN